MATVGELDVVIRGKADMLDRDLKKAEGKVKASDEVIARGQERMAREEQQRRSEMYAKQAFLFAKFAASVRVLASVAESEFNAINLAVATFNGNLSGSVREVEHLADAVRTIPLVGDVFNIGQKIGADLGRRLGIGDGETDTAGAERIDREVKQAEQERKRMLDTAKFFEDTQKRLQREIAIGGAKSDDERRMIAAQLKREEGLSGLGRLSDDQRKRIEALVEERFRIETKGEQKQKIGDFGTTISANQIGLGLATGINKAPDKRGQDKTNALLTEISGKIERNRAVALAG